MTKEQVKQVLPLMQAFAEGKTIQTKNGSTWIDIDSDKNQFILDSVVAYQDCFRVKPEPKYRPFKNAEECWQEMLKHKPFGYVKSKETLYGDVYYSIISVDSDGVLITNTNKITDSAKSNFIYMFNTYEFVDGTPFGILED